MRPILLTALVVLSCVAPGATPMRSESPGRSTTNTAAPSLAAAESGTPSPRSTPISSADVTDAGVLFFFSFSKAGWFRFDSATGRLSDIGYASVSVQAETSQIIYLAGPQGSTSLLRWDGTLDKAYDCGGGGFISFNAAGACVSFGSHTGPGPLPITVFPTPPVAVRLPGEARPRMVLPADWGAFAAALSPDSARLSVVRVEPPYPTADDQPFRMSIWLVEADGAARLLYRPAPGKGLPLQWSSDGRYLTGVEIRPGDSVLHLLLLDVASGRVTDLGNTPALPASIQWSADGRLAFVRGSGDVTWRDKEVVVRERGGASESSRRQASSVSPRPGTRRAGALHGSRDPRAMAPDTLMAPAWATAALSSPTSPGTRRRSVALGEWSRAFGGRATEKRSCCSAAAPGRPAMRSSSGCTASTRVPDPQRSSS